jgi:hypothetical protein
LLDAESGGFHAPTDPAAEILAEMVDEAADVLGRKLSQRVTVAL